MGKLAGGGEIAGSTMLLGNVKTAERLILVALHKRLVSKWQLREIRIMVRMGLEKGPDSTPNKIVSRK